MMKEIKWKMPTTFPDLSAAKALAIDIETRDPDLKSMGPGVRRNGYIVGVGIVTSDKEFQAYYPVAHDEGPNLNKCAVFNWLDRELSRPDQAKIGANLLYDFDYLTHAGVLVAGKKWLDVQNAEPLIDENAKFYNLNALARKYLQSQKLTGGLKEACAQRDFKENPASHIWQLPASVVGPYCIQDASLCIDILEKQLKILKSEDTYELFKIESYLMPVLLYMRQLGVKIDVDKLEETIVKFKRRERKLQIKLNKLAGFEVEIWAGVSLAKVFDKLDLKYPLTAKTHKPSFTIPFLSTYNHPVAELILNCRKTNKFINTFLEGQIRNHLINGRIHSQFNQMKGDLYGTVTGRFSSSNPNLQFMPARDDELGPLCRSMFIPEDKCIWGKADYSQIEYRIFAHYAQGPGSDDFRKKYNEDPDTDYHQWCSDLAGIKRRAAKDLNFGLLYGMGVRKMSHRLGMSFDEGKKFLDGYIQNVPFIRTTSRKAMSVASNRGYVRTILRRRRRFPKWEPIDRELSTLIDSSLDPSKVQFAINQIKKSSPKDYKSGIQRVGTFVALNAIVQGSSADMLKKAMVDCYYEGIFDTLHLHITVHDELDVSIPKTKKGTQAFKDMLVLMRDAIELKVPVMVDSETGPNWGEVK